MAVRASPVSSDCAISPCPYTASIAANRLGPAIPPRARRVCVLVMVDSPSARWLTTTLRDARHPAFPGLPQREAGGDAQGEVCRSPAVISVSAAVEGLKVMQPLWQDLIVPITAMIR
jgi:hypothetical protein